MPQSTQTESDNSLISMEFESSDYCKHIIKETCWDWENLHSAQWHFFFNCNMMNFGNGTSTLLHNFKGNVGDELKGEKKYLRLLNTKIPSMMQEVPGPQITRRWGNTSAKCHWPYSILLLPAVGHRLPQSKKDVFMCSGSQGANHHQYNQLHFLLECGWGVCRGRNWEDWRWESYHLLHKTTASGAWPECQRTDQWHQPMSYLPEQHYLCMGVSPQSLR